MVRALDAAPSNASEAPRSLMLRNACASWVRLDSASGHGGHRYLVHVRTADPLHRDESALSVTQAKVAEYLAAGATAREVATSMGLSPETVRTHIKNIYARLGIGSRAELVGRVSGVRR